MMYASTALHRRKRALRTGVVPCFPRNVLRKLTSFSSKRVWGARILATAVGAERRR
jgi:hypothetical protein